MFEIYNFWDGKKLTVISQIATAAHEIAADYSIVVMAHPFQYIVEDKNHVTVYVDVEGHGECVGIVRH